MLNLGCLRFRYDKALALYKEIVEKEPNNTVNDFTTKHADIFMPWLWSRLKCSAACAKLLSLLAILGCSKATNRNV